MLLPRLPPKKEEPRPLKTAGAQRRVIEGEGLGGFARRIQSIPLLPRGSCPADNFFRSGRAAPGATVPGAPGRRLTCPAELPEIGRKPDAASTGQHDIAGNHA